MVEEQKWVISVLLLPMYNHLLSRAPGSSTASKRRENWKAPELKSVQLLSLGKNSPTSWAGD